ncbi:MAG: glycosyltransferase [Chloroflexota bacterium]
MRICYLADAGSIHTHRWALGLARRGHEVTVCSHRPAAIAGVNVLVIPRPRVDLPLLTVMQQARWMRRVLDNMRPDLLHAHYLTGYGWLAAWTGFHPFVVTAHGSDVLISPESSIADNISARFALLRADAITVVARHMIPKILRLGAPRERVFYTPNWIDDLVFNPTQRKNRTKPPYAVLSTRALSPVYNVCTLARAVPLVLSRGHDVHFIVVGDGIDKTHLASYVSAAGVTSRVRFLPPIPQVELAGYMKWADVYVSTSLSDSVSTALLEAIACGAFPVVTDIPGNREVIEHEVNGLLFPAGDAHGLAERLDKALKNHDLRERAEQVNWQIIHENYLEREVVPGIERLYQQWQEHR